MNDKSKHTHGESSGEGHDHGEVSEQPRHPKHGKHPVQYFLPGKIILQFKPVGHSTVPVFTQAQLAKDIGDFLKQSSEKQQWGNQLVQPKPEDILIFPLRDNDDFVFSIVPVRLRDEKASQEDLVKLLMNIYADLSKGSLPISDNIMLNSVSPNWLIGSVGHGPHPPSPGSWPLEAPAPNPNNWKFWLRDKQTTSLLPFAADEGDGIDVAILDTAPSAINMEEAYETWHERYDLIRTLLEPTTGKLHIHRDIYATLELMDYSVVGHRYLMPDHGLFVAGIIHSIAPQAELHLYKVFTSYGSGSTETIAQGLLQVLQNRDKNRPLIVNCSFGLSIPVPGHDDSDFPVELRDPITLERMSTSLRELFDGLEKDGVIVVAAAGNDANQSVRPAARSPAAFASVIGVGALPKGFPLENGRYRVASYSNLADDPRNIGYMAFGGEPGLGQGVLGIYTSEFPVYAPIYAEGCLSFLWRLFTGTGLDGWAGPGHLPPNPEALTLDRIRYRPNTTGWAWWAGTSFATPVISGILANWCNQPAGARASNPADQDINLGNARLALNERSQTTRTDKSERVILVMQG